MKKFTGSEATEWGKRNEEQALKLYNVNQQSSGHEGLTTARSGFVICESHPFLGAPPDANVYDPSYPQPFGLAEVKCPYSCRNVSPVDACTENNFFCSLDSSGEKPLLKRNHNYYCQIQGQMGITGRAWCDCIVYTTKGLSVERINFDRDFWENELLLLFYNNCLAPEIISPIHPLGLPVTDLSN